MVSRSYCFQHFHRKNNVRLLGRMDGGAANGGANTNTITIEVVSNSIIITTIAISG
jgi:hypothetical protein